MRLILGIVIGTVVLLVGGSLFSGTLQKTDSGIISQKGLHWHPRLRIVVKGKEVPIPADIGIGPQYAGMPTFGTMGMTAMHTHDDMPIIHLEFLGIVRKEDIVLGNFFTIWGRDMRSFGANMTMKVNGESNAEFGNYVMHDGDMIELRYD